MVQSKLTLVLKLFNSKNRPAFVYKSNEVEITALFDSGAVTPVWCAGEKKLLKAYPNAIKKGDTCKISGFGKTDDNGTIFVIPTFELIGEGTPYIIKNLQVAVCKNPKIGYDFVLSDTMFSKVDTLIVRRTKKHMFLYFDKEQYQCLVRTNGESFSTSTYAQNE